MRGRTAVGFRDLLRGFEVMFYNDVARAGRAFNISSFHVRTLRERGKRALY
jgi:hypothetical protein